MLSFEVRHLYSDKIQDVAGHSDIWRLNLRQNRQWSLIAISANHGDLALIQFVVNKIKLKNIRQTERQIALFLVAFKECKGCKRHQYLDIYDFLTSKLKDKNPGKKSPLNKEGRTPLHYAANNGNFKLCKLIIEGTSNKNPESIKEWRNTQSGHTPLHYAALKGHLEICKLIMDNTTNKNPANMGLIGEEETPYHYAAKRGHLAVCQLMLDNLSDKNPGTKAMVTPLHKAAWNGHLEICKLIMDNLIDKNPANAYPRQETPYHYAAENGQLAVCQLFYDTLFDKNPATPDGLTPLHYAAENGHVEVCKLIMKNLVDKNPRTGYSWGSRLTPLDFASVNKSWDGIATRNRKLEVCQLFHENGIYINGHFPTPSPYADVI